MTQSFMGKEKGGPLLLAKQIKPKIIDTASRVIMMTDTE